MVLLIPALLMAIYICVFTMCFWRRKGGTRGLTHAVVAVVVSSGTTGVWALFVAPLLPSYQSATFDMNQIGPIDAFAGVTIFIALFSEGPNLVGMAPALSGIVAIDTYASLERLDEPSARSAGF